MLGLNGKARFEDCNSTKGNEVESILEASAKEGKHTVNLIINMSSTDKSINITKLRIRFFLKMKHRLI